MAGQIAELARDALRRDFRAIDTTTARVLLVEAGDRILAALPAVALAQGGARARGARRHPARRPHRRRRRRAGRSRSRARAARSSTSPHAPRSGPPASPPPTLAAKLAGAAGARGRPRRAGHGRARPDPARAPGGARARRHGAGAGAATGRSSPLPGLAPVAMQQGRYAARAIRDAARRRGTRAVPLRRQGQPGHDRPLEGRRRPEGPARWPASSPGRSGSLVHLVYLIGFQNRLLVVLRWTISFVTRGRGARLIVERTEAGQTGAAGPGGPPAAATAGRRGTDHVVGGGRAAGR